MAIRSVKTGLFSRNVSVGNFTDPRSLSNLQLWLDAADTSTISVSSNAVTQWNDKSTNAYTFTQGTSANRPSSGTRTINSKNVIDFDGSNDFLSSTADKSVWNFLHNPTGNTTFWVILPDATTNYSVIAFTNEGQGVYNGFTFQYVATSPQNLYYGIASNTTVCDLSFALTTGSAALYTFKADPANATLGNRLKYYKNNGAATGTNTSSGTATTNNAYITLKIGGYTGYTHFDGAIGEVIAYSSILNDSDREKVVGYLLRKWGI